MRRAGGALQAELGDRISFDLPDGGMFLWLRLQGSAPAARDLLPRAVEAGVAFVPGEAFHVDGTGADRIRLSFATLTPEELGEAAARLARAGLRTATVERLGADALRATITCFRDTLRARPELDRLNVYPVPDGDTGTNMARTLDAVVIEMDAAPAELAATCRAVAHGSLMGARGNSV